jgi:putative copper export protein
MDNEILVLVFRWLHILPATILVGGTIFLRCAYQPAEQSSEDNDKVRRRWSKLVMLSAGLLLLSGLFNTGRISMGYELPSYYHALLGTKILLALGVFFISSVLSGRSELATKVRQKETLWLNVNVFLAVAVVMLGGAMKTTDHKKKTKDDGKESSRYAAPFDPTTRV